MNTMKNLLLLLVFSMVTTLMYSQPVPPSCPGHPNCKNAGGGNNNPIICHWPMVGNIVNEAQTFRWEPIEGATEYVFTLYNSRAQELLIDTTSNTAIFLDLPNLNLEVNKQYIIIISSNNDLKSNRHNFTLRTPSDYQNILIQLESDMEFDTALGVDKHIRKSNFLHENGWNLAAVKACNFESDNVSDMMKIAAHFKELIFKFDPID